MNTLRETFIESLKGIHDAEYQIIQTLEKFKSAAGHSELKRAFQKHISQTHDHIERLEAIFKSFGEPSERKRSKGMQGLLVEGADMMNGGKGDAALILAAQKAEHYEIAVYGSLAAWARQLGREDTADILEETLAEEKSADETLTAIAESTVNVEENQEVPDGK